MKHLTVDMNESATEPKKRQYNKMVNLKPIGIGEVTKKLVRIYSFDANIHIVFEGIDCFLHRTLITCT